MGVEACLEERGLSFEVLARELSLAPRDIVFVAGSPVDGTADVESDLEVFLLTDERGFAQRAPHFAPDRRAAGRPRRCGVVYERVGGADVEVRVHFAATFEGLLYALETMDPRSDEEAVESVGKPFGLDHDEAVELLHKLRVGKPLANVEAFERLRARLDVRKLSAWNVHHALLRSGDAMAGALVSLRENDVENAYLKLTAVYDALGDAVLYARGQRIDRWKRRAPRLMALGSSSFVDRYLEVTLPRRPPSEPLGAFVERHLEAAGDVVELLRREASMAARAA